MAVTRDKKFNESMKTYFDNSSLNIPDEYPIVWNLTVSTKNTRGNNHIYKLEIPKKVKHYEIDGYTSVNGLYHESETIYREQDIPSPEELHTDFNHYFNPYSLEENGMLESFLDIFSIKYLENGDLNALINVVYYKNHIPYPYKNDSLNIDYLKEIIRDKDKEINDLMETNNEIISYRKIERKNFMIRQKLYRQQIQKMEKKMRELYNQKEQKDECPVCYEVIKNENLVLSECCHFICGTCYEKCESCPMCREIYMKKQK
jgi:hypothetical protein